MDCVSAYISGESVFHEKPVLNFYDNHDCRTFHVEIQDCSNKAIVNDVIIIITGPSTIILSTKTVNTLTSYLGINLLCFLASVVLYRPEAMTKKVPRQIGPIQILWGPTRDS